jgi:hypothetical protein
VETQAGRGEGTGKFSGEGLRQPRMDTHQHESAVAQVSKPAVSPISKSAWSSSANAARVWKPAIQQTWKSALQSTQTFVFIGVYSWF